MAALTNQNVSDLMRELNAEYQPKGKCAATPRKMRALLERLQEYTDEVQWARNKYRALGIAGIAFGPAGIAVSELLGGGDVSVAQWRRDMTNWQYRLAEYLRVLDMIDPAQLDTAEGCSEIYPLVTAPLLDGIWYQAMPGIMLTSEEKARIRSGQDHPSLDITFRDPATGDHPGGHSNAKVTDAMTPFSLGNQIVVYQDFQHENAQRLIDDLIDNAKNLGDPDKWPWWLMPVLIGGAGLGVGLVGLYAYQFLPKPPPRANHRRKQNPRTKKISAIARRFPPDSKKGRGNQRVLMLTGDVAKAMGKKDFTTVCLKDLSDAELDKLHAAVTP